MEESPIVEREGHILVTVLVRPNSRSGQFIEEITDTCISVNLRSPAREGKANKELIKRLSKFLGVSNSSVTIVAGHKNREKTLAITGVNKEEALRRLRLER